VPGSERIPDGWKGWPEQRKFAFVLTHDVESQRGLDHVKDLAQLEIQYGFRSCFNFIPEGPYSAPSALRSWLTDHGFEVGVHDLHHDGHLFASRDSFRRKAAKINRYLKEWNALGFRSGFMMRRSDWLHDLDICYDMSSFDTDPFEPEPNGAKTIFPFWVARNLEGERHTVAADSINDQPSTINHSNSLNSHPPQTDSALNQPRTGYVELPYTLPQDSTLFLMLRESDIRIWQKKLDWIADRGGMALLNVHPDFLAFDGRSPGAIQYPASWYAEFLSWVKRRYRGDYWQAKPAAIAKFVRSLESQKTNFGRASSCSSSSAGAHLPAGGLDEDCIYCRR
jgi:hypothetical protein